MDYDPGYDADDFKERSQKDKVASTTQASETASAAFEAAQKKEGESGVSAEQLGAMQENIQALVKQAEELTAEAQSIYSQEGKCQTNKDHVHSTGYWGDEIPQKIADEIGDMSSETDAKQAAESAARASEQANDSLFFLEVDNADCAEVKEKQDEIVQLMAQIATSAEQLAEALALRNETLKAEAAAAKAEAERVAADPNSTPEQIAAAQAYADQKEKEAKEGATLKDVTSTAPPFFDEQCFLLAHTPYLASYKASTLDRKLNGKRLPYESTATATSTGAWNTSDGYNASLLAEGDPFGFINHLTQYPDYEKILNMKTSEIANLQPQIRLFKIVTPYDAAGNPQPDKEYTFEIPFDSYFTKKDMEWYKAKNKRGVGVGIKDFTFSYEANNPFAVKKSIKAQLTLFANSFDELLVERGDKEFRYVDLALKTGRARNLSLASFDPKQANVRQQNLAKLDFRLKAVVGWAPPSAQHNTLSAPVKTAIYNSYVSLNLTPTIHTFDIDDQGRVKFVINYLAYVEDFFDQPNFNIFTDVEVEKNRINRKIKEQTWVVKCDSSNFSELKKAEKTKVEEDKIKSLQSLVAALFGTSEDASTQKIRYIELSSAAVLDSREQGPFFDIGNLINNGGVSTLGGDKNVGLSGQIQSALAKGKSEGMSASEERVKMLSIAGTGAENKTQTLTFFYVSDLVDIILAGLSDKFGDGPNSLSSYLASMASNPGKYLIAPDNKTPMNDTETKEQIEQQTQISLAMAAQFKRFRLLLGPLELVDQGGNFKSVFPSLGDLPISVKYFSEWLSRKMAKRDEAYYPLPKFLNDFFNELLAQFLNSSKCFNNQAKQKTRLSQAVLTSYKDHPQGPDEITELILDDRKKTTTTHIARLDLSDHQDVRPLLANISGDKNSPIVQKKVSYEVNYLTFFAGRTQPAEMMTGNEEADHKRGLFHYAIGRDRGITKTIKLKKTEATGLKELRFEQDGYDGLKQLREVFDVDIETYANVNAYPGNYIFVDPKGFSPQSTIGGTTLDLTQIGIGGYHMIVRSEHSFGPGRANSRIHAQWVASTDAKATTTEQGGSMTSAASTNAVYCWTDESNRSEEAQSNSALKDAK